MKYLSSFPIKLLFYLLNPFFYLLALSSKPLLHYNQVFFLPEQMLLPISWGSSETRKGKEPPKMATDFSFSILLSNGSDHAKMFPPPMLQKNHGPCHPSMIGLHEFKQMNLFSQSAISSTLPDEQDKACANLITSILFMFLLNLNYIIYSSS
ncbi:hypothetical protein REPUB_Repub02eG0041600 [Reevesia pubescens]